ncbi:MAG: hypothetical protein CO073_03985 [Candidatus Komeilibacteria bacterium CG_4_9_14_0_8_um_filter_36_9]|uniref:Uncharacterized protein n=1 Tax=Candidatus Komeilibacteria bacterium CG_4_9_14_0_8_um_filter_36_9 TaxID=1974473 RepID=A0A2M8DQF6_9BACT|nr:MAG: hypothetical protein CO073_03985 [Candidatus Komeilibacteria bacterium CG_4_9_14_0_8_um_filter_36_9]
MKFNALIIKRKFLWVILILSVIGPLLLGSFVHVFKYLVLALLIYIFYGFFGSEEQEGLPSYKKRWFYIVAILIVYLLLGKMDLLRIFSDASMIRNFLMAMFSMWLSISIFVITALSYEALLQVKSRKSFRVLSGLSLLLGIAFVIWSLMTIAKCNGSNCGLGGLEIVLIAPLAVIFIILFYYFRKRSKILD